MVHANAKKKDKTMGTHVTNCNHQKRTKPIRADTAYTAPPKSFSLFERLTVVYWRHIS